MIDRKRMMKLKSRNINVYLTKLLKKIDNYDSTLVCIFENNDAEYYGNRIDMYIDNVERENLKCKGKDDVLALKFKVEKNEELRNAKILFFVDKDFDQIIEYENLYCTPCHSIENLYVSERSFKKLLNDQFHINKLDNDKLFDSLISCFREFECKADNALKELTAWLMVAIEDSEKDNSIELHLKNIQINKFIKIDEYSIQKIYDINSIKTVFKIDHDICQIRYEKYLNELGSKSLRDVIRGKYRLEYYREFLKNLIKDASKGEKLFKDNKIKCSLQLSKDLVSELSAFAETPGCLKVFLSNFPQKDKIYAA